MTMSFNSMYHSQLAFAMIEVFTRHVLLHEKIITAILTYIKVPVNTNIFTTRKQLSTQLSKPDILKAAIKFHFK